MASRNRERNAIEAVECPQCHARCGTPCFYQGRPQRFLNGRPWIHPERRTLWVETKPRPAMPPTSAAQ